MPGTSISRRCTIFLIGVCLLVCQSVIMLHMRFTDTHHSSAQQVADLEKVLSNILSGSTEKSAKLAEISTRPIEGVDQGSAQEEGAEHQTELSVTSEAAKNVQATDAIQKSGVDEEPETESTPVKNSDVSDKSNCATKVPLSENKMAEENAMEAAPSCTSHNSDAWLKGPRFGNSREVLMTDTVVKHLILDTSTSLLTNEEYAIQNSGKSQAQSLLGNSLCYEKSRFLDDSESSLDDKSIRLWSVRLIFLAIHYHQHRLAIPEAKARYREGSTCPQDLLNEHDIGQFDYECGQDTKYLVVSLAGNGLGSNVRGGTVVALIAGLVLNRVVIFTNNAPMGKNGALMHSWPLASCDRRDYQCFFQASTPCTLTQDDLMNAYEMTRPELRAFTKKGIPPKGHEDHKVVRMTLAFLPQLSVPLAARERLSKYAHSLVDQLPCEDPRIPAMRKGADLILVEGEVRNGYNYAAAAQKIQHALAFYFLRPSLNNIQKIDSILEEIIPNDFEPESSVGLPIRASDKCKGESECLTFDQHMQVTNTLWAKHNKEDGTNDKDVSVIFTTESKAMVQEQLAFAGNQTLQKKYPFSFRFVTNTKDVTPDTGFIKEVTGRGQTDTADDAMLSSMSSFKSQLLPRLSIGNCCSNFHALLNDFLMEGCGAATDNTFLCLQEYEEDPALKICCGWHKDCILKKQEYIASLKQNATQKDIE